jgi:tetratricopeptide (TPR) repeat protein
MTTTAIRLLLVFQLAAAPAADPSIVFERARALLDAGDAATASPLFEQAVALAPKRAEYHDWLARSYTAEAKQTMNAVRLAYLGWNIGDELEQAIRLDPNLVDARVRLVEYYTVTPRVVGGSSIKARRQARELAKRDAALGAWADGYIAYRAKQYGPARIKLQKAVAAARDAKMKLLALTWLGWLSQETQQYDTAFATFDNMLTIDPGATQALYEIGRTAGFCHCQLDRGEAALRRYLAEKPRGDQPSLEDAKKVLEKVERGRPRPQ